MSVLLLSFVICSCAYGMETIVKTKHFDIPSQETPLPPSEKFLDIFPLTTDNFTESVMKNKDPWVVIFHEGSIPRAWKTMAASLRGSAWFGMVDINSEEKLVKKIVCSLKELKLRLLLESGSVRPPNHVRTLSLSHHTRSHP